ncbi:hypothetical protein ES703_33490 [subsurface metagenome]
MKWCPSCGRLKPYSEFHRNRARPDGFQTWCNECMKNPEYQAQYYLINRDKLLPKHNESAWASYFRRRGIPTGEYRRDRAA